MAVSTLRKRIRIGLAVFWLGVTAWLFANVQARGVDDALLTSSAAVRVAVTDTAFVFTPAADTTGAGLVFYPGALVDPAAYVPMARAVAEAGFPVVVVHLPFRLAPMARHRATLTERTLTHLGADPDRAWVVGGHSRGGALAATFAAAHAAALDGLLLVGTSHPRRDDLSALALDVTKIYGSEDGLASEEEVRAFASNLPDATHWARVEGGNHTGFAWYGWQLGDQRARISRAEQHAATVRAVVEALRRTDRSRGGPSA